MVLEMEPKHLCVLDKHLLTMLCLQSVDFLRVTDRDT